jgi:hypothetical protein
MLENLRNWKQLLHSLLLRAEHGKYYLFMIYFHCTILRMCLIIHFRNLFNLRRWLSSELLCHVVWQKFTDISGVLAASVIRVMSCLISVCWLVLVWFQLGSGIMFQYWTFKGNC